MARDVFVLKTVEDFAPGMFENTAVEGESIRLGGTGGRFVQSGCYTSPVFQTDPFLLLMPSWNAATPAGTAVEVQVRIGVQDGWSRWLSFGKWSPFIPRESGGGQADDYAKADVDTLEVLDTRHPAAIAQIRIFLYTDDVRITPQVYLLALTTKPLRPQREPLVTGERQLVLPAYSCLARDPSVAAHIPSATSLTMMLNRWGEDALPEEVARSLYDTATGRFGNLAFVAAGAGAYGYMCYLRYAPLSALRAEVRSGHAVGAVVHYRAPLLAQPDQDENSRRPLKPGQLPIYEDAVADSSGHLVVVCGFETREDVPWVLFHDPLFPTDEEAVRALPQEVFETLYTGSCLVLRKGSKGADGTKPVRRVAALQTGANGELTLTWRGQTILPGWFATQDNTCSTICYTLSDGHAYASAAQKKFYYTSMDETGALRFERQMAQGKKITFYGVGFLGETWVAEKQL